MEKQSWRIQGDFLMSCNCDVWCPCVLSLGKANPTYTRCLSWWGIHKEWTAGCRAFGKAIWDVLGERRNPDIVFEHPGEATIPTSIFVCEAGGMVVICAGTTGYSTMVDLRYHWVRQKRLQGSHSTNDEQAKAYSDLVRAGKIDPCLGQVYSFEDIGLAHYEMDAGIDTFCNRVALVGAPTTGLGSK